ncbi:hypothetical protein, unlikely [Trypanosoma brucei gambiense DAL972]|uniref:Uncharacterized protein n=1 Tax=Trypanosoma brucei gambiense (strain MHOM/CI/86/DAL972) TaxID=679716 RepID=C9ZP43_TRYB9|nr:hypothetical protein, unlikely [Trypanosoma brucei gambiense DAL972]CBH11171.1 hypothetical protein, unlikely [Trypanosoma brucei gambiense DAL972]|eukprot:XP_011773458.1 hypothetical protein, unlikely [Trypanosoma brucei gambiense DAL972]
MRTTRPSEDCLSPTPPHQVCTFPNWITSPHLARAKRPTDISPPTRRRPGGVVRRNAFNDAGVKRKMQVRCFLMANPGCRHRRLSFFGRPSFPFPKNFHPP